MDAIIAFIISHSGVVTLAGGWIASEALAFVKGTKANSVVQLFAQLLVAIGNKIIATGDAATVASAAVVAPVSADKTPAAIKAVTPIK